MTTQSDRESILRRCGEAGGKARERWMTKDASPSIPLDAIYSRIARERIHWPTLEAWIDLNRTGGTSTQVAAEAIVLDLARILQSAGYNLGVAPGVGIEASNAS